MLPALPLAARLTGKLQQPSHGMSEADALTKQRHRLRRNPKIHPDCVPQPSHLLLHRAFVVHRPIQFGVSYSATQPRRVFLLDWMKLGFQFSAISLWAVFNVGVCVLSLLFFWILGFDNSDSHFLSIPLYDFSGQNHAAIWSMSEGGIPHCSKFAVLFEGIQIENSIREWRNSNDTQSAPEQ